MVFFSKISVMVGANCYLLNRLRLREEVDILKHLSQAAVDGGHPNVLSYIDSWEEDECLFIRTELCESGNLAHFLWEYGRVFPRLDEARVWKIIVDLANVSSIFASAPSYQRLSNSHNRAFDSFMTLVSFTLTSNPPMFL